MAYQMIKNTIIARIQRAESVEQLDCIVQSHLYMLGDFGSMGMNYPALADKYPEDRDLFSEAYRREICLVMELPAN